MSVDVSGGYARLVFKLGEDVNAVARAVGNVLIINFDRPVAVSLDRLPAQAPEYIGAARHDPDGRAVRIALERKVTVNSMTAADKLFVDLLPDGWSGPPPGLPQDVVEELARRAREAERLEKLAHQAEEQKKVVPVLVRVAEQPTFVRYVFDIPDKTSVSADRAKERLTLTFDAPLAFDLADAEAALPMTVASIKAETEQDSTLVRFSFLLPVDLRTFREGKNYVVDIVKNDAAAAPARDSALRNALPPPALEAPQAQPVVEGPSPAATTLPSPPGKSSVAPAMTAPPSAAAPSRPPATRSEAPIAPQAVEAEAGGKPAAGSASPPPPAPPLQEAKPAVAEKVDTPVPAAAAESAANAPQPAASPTPAPARAERKAGDAAAVQMSRQGANLKLTFPFLTRTAGAVFHRADTLWIVFDTASTFDLAALAGEASRTIRAAEFSREGDAAIIRITLDHPHLSSIDLDGDAWTVTIGDVAEPARALEIARNLIGPNRSSVSIGFDKPQRLHRLRDPEVGDDLLVVTAFAPARGFVNEQDFVEFRALASTQGVVIEPLADDVNVDLAADKIVVGRPGGLTLSSTLQNVLRASALRPLMFDAQVWGIDRQASYLERQSQLQAAAAAAPIGKRLPPRLDLARFYIAHDMYPEAKGVLDVVLGEQRPAGEDVSASVLRAIAEVMMNRPSAALRDLSNPAVGDQHDAPLWRALAYAGEGKWGKARDSFGRVEAAIATLPLELQRVALKSEMRAAIEVGDFAGAANELNDLETIGLPREQQPAVSVLVGRLCEGLGRSEDALTAYRAAADSWDRPAAAQGRLRETALRYALGDLKREDVLSELETLTTIWRGDDTEIGALEIMARLYTEEGRFRDSFSVMHSAVLARPDSDMTRRIQDSAAATFDGLFLEGKGDALPAIDALALFYDFRELTPIGRRGDEMIRRLADRLVAVDLLDQATELLQYQVDHRLQGAARAQVAMRLAVIYLMNHKPDRALATLRASHTADLANEFRNQRLLLEARALSDLGRHDLALEVVANLSGREAIRLRSDILWAARRWTPSAEQLELYYGDRWKDWQPLNEVERADLLRAAIGYALGEDALGLGRLRERYAAKMTTTPDARAFDIVSAPLGTSGSEFRDIARAASSIDTLEGFLRDLQTRYPDASPLPPPARPPSGKDVSAPSSPSAASSMAPPARAAGKTALR